MNKILYYKSKDYGACNLMQSTGQIEELKKHFQVFIIDIEDDEDMVSSKLKSLPTIMARNEGGTWRTYEGFVPAEKIIGDFLNIALGNEK